MNVTRFLAAVVMAAMLSSCGTEPPDNGYVTSRRYEPGYYEDWVSQDCVLYDDKFQCKMYLPQHHHDWHEPTWQLCLRNEDNVDHVKTGCIYVTESVFNQYHDGQHYPEPR
jgi:hypothetical protein